MDRTKRNRRRLLLSAAAVAGAGIAVAGCGSSSSSSTTSSGSGSSLVANAYTAWCTDSALCSYASKGSGAGITDLTNGVVDWAGSDSPLNATQLPALASARGGVTPVYFPTLLAAIGVPVHVAGVTHLRFSGPVLADIFDGAITKWSDPKIASENPGAKLPSSAITVCVRADGSGTSQNFTNWLGIESPAFIAKVGPASQLPNWTAPLKVSAPKNPGVLQCVKDNPNAIGYADLADVIKAGDTNLLASIKAPDGTYVSPTSAAVSTAGTGATVGQPIVPKTLQKSLLNSTAKGAYPITITSFVLGYSDYAAAGKSASLPKVKAWLDYVYGSKAQGQLAGFGYAPLPATILNAGKAQEASLH